MAVVNLTPDSFYDGGKFESVSAAIGDIEEKLQLGANIIDLGAASSRPGAPEISEEEEWDRLAPVLKEARKRFPETFISVDTWRAGIAEKAASLGADIINDIGGGGMDDNMFETVARIDLPYVLMHIEGNPQTMASNKPFENVIAEVTVYFEKKIALLKSLGFEKIILDPGFGFGKSLRNNFELLKKINDFSALGFPLLAGVSRKSMINKVIGTNPVTALNGTTVLHTIALLNGANVLRVHDVQEARQVIELISYYSES